MAEPAFYRFRTAVGGFHKGDVSAYIEKTASAHQAELAQLEQALTAAQQENENLRASLTDLQAKLDAIHEASDSIQEEPAVAVELSTPEHVTELELHAYRRAEAAERLAYQRAGRLYADMQHIHDSASAQLQQVSQDAGQAMEAMDAALVRIKSALERTQQESRQAAEALEAMGALLPDPAEGLEAAE